MDPTGKANWSYYSEKCNHPEIIERDDGMIWCSNGPAWYFAKHQAWTARERKAMRYVRGRVLDLGCGVGRHALHLQDKNHRVTGIDISPLNIRICRKRGLKDARVMSVAHLQFPPQSFDSILMLGGGFGLAGNRKATRRLLRRLHVLTTDHALITAESIAPRFIDASYRRRNADRGRMPGQFRMRVRWYSEKTRWFDFLYVSKQEMTSIIQGTGWQVTRFVQDKDFAYIAVIEKEPPVPR